MMGERFELWANYLFAEGLDTFNGLRSVDNSIKANLEGKVRERMSIWARDRAITDLFFDGTQIAAILGIFGSMAIGSLVAAHVACTACQP